MEIDPNGQDNIWDYILGGLCVVGCVALGLAGCEFPELEDESVVLNDEAAVLFAEASEDAPIIDQAAADILPAAQEASLQAEQQLTVNLGNGEIPVIGKMTALNNYVCGDNEFKLAAYLPDLGNDSANWAQNERTVTMICDSGRMIKDLSYTTDISGWYADEVGIIKSFGYQYYGGYWFKAFH